jgi:hypothetical protein
MSAKVYVRKCKICGREIVSLSEKQAEANLKSHMLRHEGKYDEDK